MTDDPTPTLMSIGRCFVGALHGPSDKANDKVSVVNWNSGIRMAPSSKYCSAQCRQVKPGAGHLHLIRPLDRVGVLFGPEDASSGNAPIFV